MTSAPDGLGNGVRVTREIIAPILWGYVLVKLFVFDVDVYLLDRFAPSAKWLLNAKAVLIIAALAALWLVFRRSFVRTLGFVAGYPVILALWRLPRSLGRRWPLLVAFAPGIYRTMTVFRMLFLLYAAAGVAALAIAVASTKWLLIVSMVVLSGFLIMHFGRSFRKAYSSSIFADLADIARKMGQLIESGKLDTESAPVHDVPAVFPGSQAITTPDQARRDPLVLYIVRASTDVIAKKVEEVARSRKYDFYLLSGWIYTILLTVVVFAFQYLAMYKLNPAAFIGESMPTFWSFVGLSFGALTRVGVSPIEPGSQGARWIFGLEGVSSFFILVVLAFTLLRAGRESVKDEIDAFTKELRAVAALVDSRLTAVYAMTLAETEDILVTKHKDLINGLRQLRGLPPVP